MTIKQNPVVSEAELNGIYEKMVKQSELLGIDPYLAYISTIRDKVVKITENDNRLPVLEKHHITPRFEGGTDDPENLILLTVKEHVIAHWLRWKVKGKRGDYTAFLFRIGDTEEALQLQREAIMNARERDRENQAGFFNSDFQRKMGSRGGIIGGSRNTEAQFLARQEVGLTYGRQTGIGNQSPGLRTFIDNYSIWCYTNNKTDEKLYCLVSPKSAFVDVTRQLEVFVPGLIKNSSSMHKLFAQRTSSNWRPQMYGWKIGTTLTRSEVKEGIKQFISPTVIFLYDEEFMLLEGLE
jgi:hypothetical protein